MRRRVELSSRDIVNAEFASRNDCGNFLDSDLTRIADFQRTSGNVAAIVNREHDRFKDRPVGFIEGAIDEDAVRERRIRHSWPDASWSSIFASALFVPVRPPSWRTSRRVAIQMRGAARYGSFEAWVPLPKYTV